MTTHFGLIILDGWGIGDGSLSDAIAHANTPTMDGLFKNYPHGRLKTHGEDVGLPQGQMGNSEVGHLNIGAGRIVYQELTRINKSIREGDFFSNKVLIEAMEKARMEKKNLHLMGLVSNGGVHSSQEHLYALCQMAKAHHLQNVYIHAFTDGRDCDPKSANELISQLEDQLVKSTGKIVSVIGRYFAMDRDNRWERIKKAYNLLVKGEGAIFSTALEGINASYTQGVTDEFIEPISIRKEGEKPVTIGKHDVVICFNFRTDRPREITEALTQRDFPEHGMTALQLHYVSMTNYDARFKDMHVAFEKDHLQNTLGEVLSKLGKTQLRIAETEKYPHVTFFFGGGREEQFSGESRLLVDSPKVATYDLKPEMSALEVKNQVIAQLTKEKPNFICLNFANPDMVGHTGVYDAIKEAIETVDHCLGEVIRVGLDNGYEFLVIADHGNADFALNSDGSPNTAHSLNPVPAILVSKEKGLTLKNGILADVAPTILRRMGIAAPIEMTGKSLA